MQNERSKLDGTHIYCSSMSSRGRIGRGGRLVFDRLPMSSEASSLRVEEYARPGLYDVGMDLVRKGLLQQAAEGNEVVAYPNRMPATMRSRLRDICMQSDSDDGLLDPTGLSSLVDTSKPKVDASKVVKFSLKV